MSDSLSISLSSLPEYLSTKQLEQYYGLPRTTVHRYMIKEGFPTGIQVGPGSVRWRKSEVDAWYDSRSFAHIHDTGCENSKEVD